MRNISGFLLWLTPLTWVSPSLCLLDVTNTKYQNDAVNRSFSLRPRAMDRADDSRATKPRRASPGERVPCPIRCSGETHTPQTMMMTRRRRAMNKNGSVASSPSILTSSAALHLKCSPLAERCSWPMYKKEESESGSVTTLLLRAR